MSVFAKHKKVVVNGKKIGRSTVDKMVLDACDNIILSGFSNAEDLYHLIQINGCKSEHVMIAILDYLLSTYTAGIRKESKDVLYDPICASNVVSIGKKLNIVCELLTDISNLHTDTVEDVEEEEILAQATEEDTTDDIVNSIEVDNLVDDDLEIIGMSTPTNTGLLIDRPSIRIPENWGYANAN